MDYESYAKYTDEELIQMLRDGDEAVTDYLCDKYKNLARYKAKSMYILGAEPEDLIQEGMIGLFKAVRDYDAGRDAGFSTFAELCISRQIYKAVQASNRLKAMPLNSYVSLNASAGDNSENELNLIDTLVSTLELNPEEILIDMESVKELDKGIENELSSFEKQVFELKLTGMGMSEIAKVLGKEKKQVDNAIQRIHAKLDKIIASIHK